MYTYSAFNELTAFLVFTQLMLDYHIGAASIARSLAGYWVSVLELIPFFKDNIPSWVGHGEEVLGALSINILAPILLGLLTLVLCRGVGESSILNSIMTVTKVGHSLYFLFDLLNFFNFCSDETSQECRVTILISKCVATHRVASYMSIVNFAYIPNASRTPVSSEYYCFVCSLFSISRWPSSELSLAAN